MPRRRPPTGVLDAIRDPWLRVVVLTRSTMDHIERRHPELAGAELAVTTAVEKADFRCRAKGPGREVLYAANIGPSAWLAVVVAYSEARGTIVTAFGSKTGPQTGDII